MTDRDRERLLQLCEVVEREVQQLRATDAYLFQRPFTAERVASLREDERGAESVDAFVARFGRLQDTLGDKLIPALLRWVGNAPGPMIDNLRLLEKWGWLQDAEGWLETRQLRNRLIHEYELDEDVLVDALNTAHQRVTLLISTAQRLVEETRRRLTPL
ncbi:hypothetical protein [Tepidimonas charontis]|uniref:Nucleotidyltransferase substrate binding protein n=1 Tax=Tepidimonas charontis TaxID=2267262 RepID=A0A554XDF1_9BURK|nr:hypothetical protein [Tepidimonas charontis]TSE33857.1 hypothetical protein Tchar_01609 [Tepidimonas charontis]